MEDSRNKHLVKLMWLPDEKEIIFDLHTETPIAVSSALYDLLSANINLKQWKKRYSEMYRQWLNDDNDSIYDINNEINLNIINALAKTNGTIENQMIFYWFDVDRTLNQKFNWEYCPLSKKRLVPLGGGVANLNYYRSREYPIIFPLMTES